MWKNVLLLFLLINGIHLGVNAQNDSFYLIDTTNFSQLTQRERDLMADFLPKIKESTNDSIKVKLLHELYSQFNDNDVWGLYLELIRKTIEQPGFKKRYPEVYGDYLIRYYNDHGYYLKKVGQTSEALDNYFEALSNIEIIQDDTLRMELEGGVLNNIARIHFKLKEYEKSKQYQLKAQVLYEALDLQKEIAISVNNLGILYRFEDKDDSARIYFERAAQIMTENNLRRQHSSTLINLAEVYAALDLKEKADSAGRLGYKLAMEQGDLFWLSNASNFIAVNFRKAGQWDSAFYYAQIGHETATKLGAPHALEKSTDELYKLYKQSKDYGKALEMHEAFMFNRDSLVNEKLHREAVKKEGRYQYEKQKALDDKENEKRIALEQQKQAQQFRILILIGCAGVVVFILLIVIYRRLKLTRKQKLIIEERNEEVEAQRDQIEVQKDTIEEKHNEIHESINYAKRIQSAILPPMKMLEELLPENFIYYLPKDVVAGDFYWMVPTETHVYFAVADCTGHGVPGAMVSVVCHGALNRCIREYKLKLPSEILDKTRELVLNTFENSEEQVKDGMDIAICRWEKKTGKVEYSGANNPLYIYRKADEEIEIIKADKEPIGYMIGSTPFTNHSIELLKGDVLYLFSDGYADQFGGPKGKKMGYKKFRAKLMEVQGQTMKDQSALLETYFKEWLGTEEQIDDVCVMGLRAE